MSGVHGLYDTIPAVLTQRPLGFYLAIVPLPEDLRLYLPGENVAGAIMVYEIDPGGHAFSEGVREGDIIYNVNGAVLFQHANETPDACFSRVGELFSTLLLPSSLHFLRARGALRAESRAPEQELMFPNPIDFGNLIHELHGQTPVNARSPPVDIDVEIGNFVDELRYRSQQASSSSSIPRQAEYHLQNYANDQHQPLSVLVADVDGSGLYASVLNDAQASTSEAAALAAQQAHVEDIDLRGRLLATAGEGATTATRVLEEGRTLAHRYAGAYLKSRHQLRVAEKKLELGIRRARLQAQEQATLHRKELDEKDLQLAKVNVALEDMDKASSVPEELISCAAALRRNLLEPMQLAFLKEMGDNAGRQIKVASPFILSLWRTAGNSGSALAAAAVMTANLGVGPSKSSNRRNLSGGNRDDIVVPRGNCTPEEGKAIMKFLLSELGFPSGLDDVPATKRPCFAITLDATAVTGQSTPFYSKEGVVPVGLVDDPTYPIVPVVDEKTAEQAFFGPDGEPRESYTQVMVGCLNPMNRSIKPAFFTLDGLRPQSETDERFRGWVECAFSTVDQSGGRVVAVGGDGAACVENFYQEHCATSKTSPELPVYYIGLSFEDGTVVFGKLVKSTQGDYNHILLPASDQLHGGKKIKTPPFRFAVVKFIGLAAILAYHLMLSHAKYPQDCGFTKALYCSQDKQSVVNAQVAGSKRAQEAVRKVGQECNTFVNGTAVWQQTIYYLFEAVCNFELTWEQRLMFIQIPMVVSNAHKFYLDHRQGDCSWNENGICSEVERRDLRYISATMISLHAYWIVEKIEEPLNPEEAGSNCNELFFRFGRTMTNQKELSIGDWIIAAKRFLVSYSDRQTSDVKNAPRNDKGGEFWGNPTSGFKTGDVSIVEFTKEVEAANLKARAIAQQMFRSCGVELPTQALNAARLIVRHPSVKVGETFIPQSNQEEELKHVEGEPNEVETLDADEVAGIMEVERLQGNDTPLTQAMERAMCPQSATAAAAAALTRVASFYDDTTSVAQGSEVSGTQATYLRSNVTSPPPECKLSLPKPPVHEAGATSVKDCSMVDDDDVVDDVVDDGDDDDSPAPSSLATIQEGLPLTEGLLPALDVLEGSAADAVLRGNGRRGGALNSKKANRSLVIYYKGYPYHVLHLFSTVGGRAKIGQHTRVNRFFGAYANVGKRFPLGFLDAINEACEGKVSMADVLVVFKEGPVATKSKKRTKTEGQFAVVVVLSTHEISPKKASGGFLRISLDYESEPGCDSVKSSKKTLQGAFATVELSRSSDGTYVLPQETFETATGLFSGPQYRVYKTNEIVVHSGVKFNWKDKHSPVTLHEHILTHMTENLGTVREEEQRRFLLSEVDREAAREAAKKERSTEVKRMLVGEVSAEIRLSLGAALYGTVDQGLARTVLASLRDATEVEVSCTGDIVDALNQLVLVGLSREVGAESPVGGGYLCTGFSSEWDSVDVRGHVLMRLGETPVGRLHSTSDANRLGALHTVASNAELGAPLVFLKLKMELPQIISELPVGWEPSNAASLSCGDIGVEGPTYSLDSSFSENGCEFLSSSGGGGGDGGDGCAQPHTAGASVEGIAADGRGRLNSPIGSSEGSCGRENIERPFASNTGFSGVDSHRGVVSSGDTGGHGGESDGNSNRLSKRPKPQHLNSPISSSEGSCGGENIERPFASNIGFSGVDSHRGVVSSGDTGGHGGESDGNSNRPSKRPKPQQSAADETAQIESDSDNGFEFSGSRVYMTVEADDTDMPVKLSGIVTRSRGQLKRQQWWCEFHDPNGIDVHRAACNWFNREQLTVLMALTINRTEISAVWNRAIDEFDRDSITASFHAGIRSVVVSIPSGKKGALVDLTGSHMRRLIPPTYLNDELVNTMAYLVMERAKRACIESTPSDFSIVYSSYLMGKLEEHRGDLTEFERICKREKKQIADPFKHTWIFVPINKDLHWTMIAANMFEKKIYFINSLENSDSGRIWVDDFTKFLQFKAVGANVSFNLDEWKVILSKNAQHPTPQQPDGYNCGVFILMAMYYITSGQSWDSRVIPNEEVNGDQFRLFIALCLLQQKAV